MLLEMEKLADTLRAQGRKPYIVPYGVSDPLGAVAYASTVMEIAEQAAKSGAHVVGLSILSGSHVALAEAVLAELSQRGLDVPVVAGGIIPPEDAARLKAAGIAAVYTPKDFELTGIMRGVVGIAAAAAGEKAA